MHHFSSWKRIAAILTALFFLAVASTNSPAFAHTELVSSDPTPNSHLEELPEFVILTFAQPVLQLNSVAGSNQIVVTDPAGKPINQGEAEINGSDVLAHLQPVETPGRYTIAYRVVSSDGHPIEGSYTFDVGTAKASGPITNASDNHTNRIQKEDWTLLFLGMVGVLAIAATVVIFQRKTKG